MLFVMTQILMEMTAKMFLGLIMYFSNCALFSGMKVLYGVHKGTLLQFHDSRPPVL